MSIVLIRRARKPRFRNEKIQETNSKPVINTYPVPSHPVQILHIISSDIIQQTPKYNNLAEDKNNSAYDTLFGSEENLRRNYFVFSLNVKVIVNTHTFSNHTKIYYWLTDAIYTHFCLMRTFIKGSTVDCKLKIKIEYYFNEIK